MGAPQEDMNRSHGRGFLSGDLVIFHQVIDLHGGKLAVVIAIPLFEVLFDDISKGPWGFGIFFGCQARSAKQRKASHQKALTHSFAHRFFHFQMLNTALSRSYRSG